ncbi:16443_t:CDS:2 [Rhizophagus irregularis]|nr:16443_t:CDS:2 [Rhizophagus irregularis]
MVQIGFGEGALTRELVIEYERLLPPPLIELLNPFDEKVENYFTLIEGS